MISRAPKGRSKVPNGQLPFIEGDARLKMTDLGGVERLSEGQKQMARRCAMLSVECEKMESAAVAGLPFDVDRYGLLTDRLGRAFQRLGLRRIAHDVTPDLGVYLTATATAKPQDGLGAIHPSDELKRPPAAKVAKRRA
jgi:hypothetical protein